MPHSRVVPERSEAGENSRANEIPRSRFSSRSLSPPRHYPHAPSLIPSSFFRYLLLFRSADRTRPQQRRAFPAGEARRADEYLSERKTNSRSAPTLSRLPPSFALSRPSLHGVRSPGGKKLARGWKCGLFAEKSHSVGRAAAARITLFARGRAGCKGLRGEG